MTNLVLGGLKFKSDMVFGQRKPTHIEKTLGLVIDTCKYTKAFGDSMASLLGTGDLSREKSKHFQYIQHIFSTESDPTYQGSSEVLAMPIIRGLRVAAFYQLMEDKSTGDMYKLSHVSVKDDEVLNAMGLESLDLTEPMLKWVQFFKRTETKTIPEYIPKYTLTEYGFPILRDEDNVDSKAADTLRIDLVLTAKALDCLEHNLSVEAIVRGWLGEFEYMVHNKMPHMDAVVVGVSANRGYLSSKFALKSQDIEKSINYIRSTKRSLINRLAVVGFITPFVDTTETKFSFGSNLYTNFASVNSMLTCIQYTNKVLRSLKKHKEVVGFIRKCKTDTKLTEEYPIYLKNYKYQVLGICLSPNYMVIDKKVRSVGHEEVVMIRPHSSMEELRIEVAKTFGLNYEQYKIFIKHTGYNGTRNVMTKKNLKLLELDDIRIDTRTVSMFEEVQQRVKEMHKQMDLSRFIKDQYAEPANV